MLKIKKLLSLSPKILLNWWILKKDSIKNMNSKKEKVWKITFKRNFIDLLQVENKIKT
jgi:hypothetical protein